MRTWQLFGPLVLLCLLLAGCGGGSSDADNPTETIAACLSDAGATIADSATELRFAAPQGLAAHHYSGADRSGTLAVGSFSGSSSGGWTIFYVVRKGVELQLATVVRHPDNGAKVVAYVHPRDPAVSAAARACLG